jgi:hypothetical protein
MKKLIIRSLLEDELLVLVVNTIIKISHNFLSRGDVASNAPFQQLLSIRYLRWVPAYPESSAMRMCIETSG